MKRLAWTGGANPLPYESAPKAEQRLATRFFNEDLRMYVNFWGGIQADTIDVAKVLWNRARYDAHATIRAQSGSALQ